MAGQCRNSELPQKKCRILRRIPRAQNLWKTPALASFVIPGTPTRPDVIYAEGSLCSPCKATYFFCFTPPFELPTEVRDTYWKGHVAPHKSQKIFSNHVTACTWQFFSLFKEYIPPPLFSITLKSAQVIQAERIVAGRVHFSERKLPSELYISE